MSTFLIKTEKTLTRQEGDTADIVFTVPVALDMTNYPIAHFLVVDAEGTSIIEKTTEDSDPEISIIGQSITIILNPEDTKGSPGEFRWELQVSNNAPIDIKTIGRGDYIIDEEIIE